MDVKIYPKHFRAYRAYNNEFIFEIDEGKSNSISMRVENPKELIDVLTEAYNDRNTY